MTTWVTREEIGLAPADPHRLTLRTAEQTRDKLGLTFHHTGYGGTLWKPDQRARLRGIQAAHMAPGGLGAPAGGGDIAYALGFDADAFVYELRSSIWVGAHASGAKRGGMSANLYTDGVCYLEDGRGWTRGAAVALGSILDLYLLVTGRHAHAFAHEWWNYTECPGTYLVNVVRFLGGSF